MRYSKWRQVKFNQFLSSTEYLIREKKIYVYPLMRMFSEVGRYLFYGAAFLVIFVIFIMSLLLIKFSSVGAKQKPKKDKVKNKKPQQQNQQHQQAQKHSPPAHNTNGMLNISISLVSSNKMKYALHFFYALSAKKKKQNKQD